MNGSEQMGPDTPLAYYTPVAITPGTIKWFGGAVLGLIGLLATMPVAERYMMPAKQSDLDGIAAIVKVMQQGQTETKQTLDRLTIAVDNLSGIVDGMRRGTKSAKLR